MIPDRSSSQGRFDSQDVERTAAEWELRVQRGLTEMEDKQLARWLQRDPRHAAVFAEMRETSQLLDQLRDPLLAKECARQDSLREVDPVAGSSASLTWQKQRKWLFPAILAAAAAVVFAWLPWRGPFSAELPFAQVAATDVGGWRKLELPDGSVVQLNTDSAVEVLYTAAERRVRLTRGEAFFSVARNSARPFWVEARTVAVRAVGTAFNVRHRAEAIEVLVTEGKVRVDSDTRSASLPASSLPTTTGAIPTNVRNEPMAPSNSGERLLIAGQKALVPIAVDPTQPATPISIDSIELPRIGRALAWQERRLEFADVPLCEVVAEFNRYNHHKLVIDDPTLAARMFGGAFTPNGYESFVEILQQSFGIVAERRDNETILRPAR
jgi:transmembrane sensor